MFHRGSMHMRWFSTTIGLYRYPHFRQQPKKLDKKVHRCPRVYVVSFTILLFKGVSIFAAMGIPSPQTDYYFLPALVKSVKVQNQAIRIILDSVFMPRDQIGRRVQVHSKRLGSLILARSRQLMIVSLR